MLKRSNRKLGRRNTGPINKRDEELDSASYGPLRMWNARGKGGDQSEEPIFENEQADKVKTVGQNSYEVARAAGAHLPYEFKTFQEELEYFSMNHFSELHASIEQPAQRAARKKFVDGRSKELEFQSKAFLGNALLDVISLDEISLKDFDAFLNSALRKSDGVVIGERHAFMSINSNTTNFLISNIEVIFNNDVRNIYLEGQYNGEGHLNDLVSAAKSKGMNVNFVDNPVTENIDILNVESNYDGADRRVSYRDKIISRLQMFNYVSTLAIKSNPGKYILVAGKGHVLSYEGVMGVSELNRGVPLQFVSADSESESDSESDSESAVLAKEARDVPTLDTRNGSIVLSKLDLPFLPK